MYAEAGYHGSSRSGVDPEPAAALGLIALMDGLRVQWRSNRNAVGLVAALRSYLEKLLTVPVNYRVFAYGSQSAGSAGGNSVVLRTGTDRPSVIDSSMDCMVSSTW